MHFRPGQQSSFYLFLGTILLLHGCLMLMQMRTHTAPAELPVFQPLKLKLVQESGTVPTRPLKQIVQSEDSSSPNKPEERSFLSDKNRQFDRQTMARKNDIFKSAAKGNALINNKSRSKSILKDLKLSQMGVGMDEPVPTAVSRAPASVATQGLENGDPLAQGLSATNDYVEEVTLGDFTHLNTVEYKYYGFFHRIRQKLEQFWGKSIQEKAQALVRAGRRLPASENLVTSLQITLNAQGEIIGVKILGASGVKELDDAAIESFNQAGPFPNPPKDLLVNGKAVIQWGFVVKS